MKTGKLPNNLKRLPPKLPLQQSSKAISCLVLPIWKRLQWLPLAARPASIHSALVSAKEIFTTAVCGADGQTCSLADNPIGGRIAQQQELQRSVVRGLLDRYVDSRLAKEEAQAELEQLKENYDSAFRAIDLINTIRNLIDKIPFVSKPSFSDVANAFSDFVDRVPFVSGGTKAGWRRSFNRLISIRDESVDLEKTIRQQIRAEESAISLLTSPVSINGTDYQYFAENELTSNWGGLISDFVPTSDTMIDGSDRYREEVDNIQIRMLALTNETVAVFQAAINAAEALVLDDDSKADERERPF